MFLEVALVTITHYSHRLKEPMIESDSDVHPVFSPNTLLSKDPPCKNRLRKCFVIIERLIKQFVWEQDEQTTT